MSKKTWVPVILMALALSASGCGQNARQTSTDDLIPLKASNPQIQKFNQELGEIKNQDSAEKAVNTFIDYVDSRIETSSLESSSLSLRGYLEAKNLIKKIAASELALRSHEAGLSTLAVEDGEIPILPLDVSSITDTINILGKDQNLRVDDEIVKKTKAATEASLPNLNPGKTETMTPLEGMAIAYALTTGDDGSAPAESINLPREKAKNFLESIVPSGGDEQ